MTNTDDFLKNAMERECSLRDLTVLFAGISTMMSKGGKHISAYHDLLEDEWEGRQSALDFLRKGNFILSKLMFWNRHFSQEIRESMNFELLSVAPVIEGIGGMARRTLDGNLLLDNKSASLINGDAFLMQETLLEVLQEVASKGGEQPIIFGTVDAEIGERELRVLHSELTPGAYVVISMSSVGWESLDLGMYVSVADMKLNEEETSEDVSFLRWMGLASLHNGEMFIHRDGVGGGVLFFIPVSSSGEECDLRAKMVNGRKETVLLVDDEDMIWDVIMDMLGDLGYTVLLAANGKEAVDIYLANKNEIDIVLLDMVMPVMNAREAFHILKENAPDVKVLLASGYVDEEDVQDVLGAGAMGFMRKPYRLKDLARKIREILDRG